MTNYYVDFVNGLDANNGLGPDASHASNKPWKTLGKLLGASGFASGDTAYLSPAGPFREVVTVAMTSATVETKILGDPSNAQGFKTSGGALVDPGPVVWTAYLTNEQTTPSTSPLLNLAGRDFLTFQYIYMMGGSGGTNASVVDATTTLGSTDVVLRDCVLAASGATTSTSNRCISQSSSPQQAANWLVDRCVLINDNTASCIVIATSTTNTGAADWDMNFVIQNCVLLGGGGGTGCNFAPSTTGLSFKPGGMVVKHCLIRGYANGVTANNTGISTTIPSLVYNNELLGLSLGMQANATTQMTEDFNLIQAATLRTNVTAGANSKQVYAPMLDYGLAMLQGFADRNLFTPMVLSAALTFGTNATYDLAVDIANRPVPAGGQSLNLQIGPFGRHNTAAKETTTVDAGGVGETIVGPGDQSFTVPVDATATTITIRARYDTTHAATNKPQVILGANPAIGVTTQTVTMTAAADTWETLTIGPFTPTAKGIVSLRLVSRAAAGGGKAFFDTVTGANVNAEDLAYFNQGEPLASVNGTGASGSSGVRRLALTGGVIG